MHHATLQHQGAWSFGNSHKSQWYFLPSKENPGPNAHKKFQQSRAPAWSIGKAQRRSITEVSPTVDSGVYNPKMSAVYPENNGPTIGNEGIKDRGPRYSTVVTYNPRLQSTKPQAPSFSMGYRVDTEYDNGRPGPTDYEALQPNDVTHNKTENHFTRTKKIDPAWRNMKTPGVGAYNIENKYLVDLSPKVKFGTASRPSPGLNTSSPAIYYKVDEKNKEGTGITMGQQLPVSFNKFVVPGPDKYNIQSRKKYEARKEKSMYTSNRSECAYRNSSFKASPGSYEVSTNLLNQEKGATFGTSLRGRLSSLIIPGPGSYESRSTLKSTLGKMVWRHSTTNRFQTPAPGAYNLAESPSDKYRSVYSKGMPLAQRPDLGRSMTNHIGPGEYDVGRRFSTEAGVLSKSPRKGLPTNKNPGPGQYEIPTTIGRIPKYFKLLTRKISELGQTKIIKYNPKEFKKEKMAEVLVLKTQQNRAN